MEKIICLSVRSGVELVLVNEVDIMSLSIAEPRYDVQDGLLAFGNAVQPLTYEQLPERMKWWLRGHGGFRLDKLNDYFFYRL